MDGIHAELERYRAELAPLEQQFVDGALFVTAGAHKGERSARAGAVAR